MLHAAVACGPFSRSHRVATLTEGVSPYRSPPLHSEGTSTIVATTGAGKSEGVHTRAPQVVDRPRHQGGRHRATARRRRRPEGRQRPSRHGDEPGAAGLPALPAGDAPRPDRPAVGRPRPVHPVQRALVADPVLPAVPVRLRPRAVDDLESLRTWESLHAGPPRVPPHRRRRGHHRPARPGRRQRRRHGDGRAPRARPVRPRRRAGRVAVRPPHLRHRRRRLHGRGRLERGVLARRAPAARQPDPASTTTTTSRSRTTPRSRSARTSLARYEAYGWHVQRVDSGEDVAALESAIETAQRVTDKPSFIAVRTIIGWPAPTQQNTGKAHGSALGDDEIAKTKEILGFDPDVKFAVDDEVLAHARRRHRPRPRGARRVAEGATTPGPRRTRGGLRPARADARTARCPTAGPTRCRPGRSRRTASPTRSPPARRPARCSPSCAGAARAVGRVGRPRREQQHHDGGRAELHPVRPPDQDVAGRPVRPHAALRHPRARDGRDPQRHQRARRHPRLRRHVPRVQRLHAPAGTAGRADAAAVDLRVDARLDRPRRRRPDPPADRAPRGAARDSGVRHGPPGRRQRDGGLLAPDPREDRRAGGARAVAAEPAGARPGQGRPTRARAATSSRRLRPGGPR